jgi:hypothetical protein
VTQTTTSQILRPAIAVAGVFWLALALVLLSPSATVPATAEAKQSRGKQGPPAPLYWGAQIGPQLTGEEAPWDMRAVRKFERLTRKKLSLISFSAPFADCTKRPCSFYSFPTTPLENTRAYGAVPLFNWTSEGRLGSAGAPAFRLSKLIDGTYDSYIRAFAEGAADWGHPFLLRFNWEMNGNWFPWSEGVNGNRPGQYVAAWRHVHNIFSAVGATNVSWVWCPNVDVTGDLDPLKPLYPGHDYVDWTCLDGFNWGGRTRNTDGWKSFSEIYRSTYRRIIRIAPRKPMVIAEVASDERGGSKAAWIRNMLRVVPSQYRKIRGLVWYNEMDRGMRWPIESSRASKRAFARGIRRNVYRPNLFSEIATSPIPPPGRN